MSVSYPTDTFTIQQPSKRMEWLDAMRGMAMLMVIYTHQVLGSPLEHIGGTVDFFGTFMLPMFFFISGYLSTSTSLPIKLKIKKLSRQLLLPTIVVYTANGLVYNHSFDFYDQMKAGYWFLPTLFVMEVIASVLFKWLAACSFKWKVVIICLVILIDKIVMTFAFRYGVLSLPLSKAFQVPLFLTFITPFFIGAMIRYIDKKFDRFIDDNAYGIGIIIAAFIVLCCLPFSLVGFIMPTVGVVIIFIVMRRYGNYFSSNGSIIGKYLVICGKNTLGLYLLHYFILQSVICHFSSVLLIKLDMMTNPLMQFLILGISTLMTTMITFIGIRVIELSPILSLLCLGQQIKKKK